MYLTSKEEIMRYWNRVVVVLALFVFAIVGGYSQQIRQFGDGLSTYGTILDYGYDESQGTVYAAGDFDQIGNVSSPNLAYFEDGQWYNLIESIDGIIYDVEAGNDVIYIYGNYRNINNKQASGIVSFDGNDWRTIATPLGTGGYISELKWHNEKLYVAGLYESINGIENKGLSAWDGQSWGTYENLDAYVITGFSEGSNGLYAYGYLKNNDKKNVILTLSGNVWINVAQSLEDDFFTLKNLTVINGEYWSASDNKVYKWSGQIWSEVLYSKRGSLLKYKDQLYIAKTDNIGARYRYLVRFENGSYTTDTLAIIEDDVVLSYPFIRATLEVNDDLWVSGDFVSFKGKGLIGQGRFTNNEWEAVGHTKSKLSQTDLHTVIGRKIINFEGETIIIGNSLFMDETVTFCAGVLEDNTIKPLGELRGFTRDAMVYDGNLIVTGSNLKTEDRNLGPVAKWDGSRWSAFYDNGQYATREIVVVNDGLYAYGYMYQDQLYKMYLNKWNTQINNWDTLTVALKDNVIEARELYSINEWQGKLLLNMKTLPQIPPILLDEDLEYEYLGSQVLTNGQIHSVSGRLFHTQRGRESINEWNGNQWINHEIADLGKDGELIIFELDNHLYCSGVNGNLYREHPVRGWEYISNIDILGSAQISANKYVLTGYFPYCFYNGYDAQHLKSLAILELKKPKIEFEVSQYEVCQNEYINFKPIHQELQVDYEWIFQGGTPERSDATIPFVKYKMPGSYTVFLIAKGLYGTDTVRYNQNIVVSTDCNKENIKAHNAQWVMGNKKVAGVPTLIFNTEGVDTSMIRSPEGMGRSNLTMSNSDGDLKFYTNGYEVMNADNEIIDNSEDFNYGSYIETYNGYYDGSSSFQNIIAIPMPNNSNNYYLFHITQDRETPDSYTDVATHWDYSVIDMAANNGKGSMSEKTMNIAQGDFMYGTMQAVKHCNGTDWWVIIGSRTSNHYYKILLTANGIENLEQVEWRLDDPDLTIYQSAFSPDGSKFVVTESNPARINLWDVDNCTGTLYNYQPVANVPETAEYGTIGCSFSPNSRFLYISDSEGLKQIDLCRNESNSLNISGVAEGSIYFYYHALGPDGKIYICHPYSSLLSVINEPNKEGLECNVTVQQLELSVYSGFPNNLWMPTYPHYNVLPAYDGSCDPLFTNTENVETSKLTVYPNPFEQYLTIKGLSGEQQTALVLFDINGRKLSEIIVNNVSNYSWDLKSIPSGTYMLHVTDEMSTEILKVVKVE